MVSGLLAVCAVMLALFVGLTAAAPARAHEMAYTVLTLNQDEDGMTGTVQIPAEALALALDDPTWAEPSTLDGQRTTQLTRYVLDHFAPTNGGRAWDVEVSGWRNAAGEQNSAGDYTEYAADVRLTAPEGVATTTVELGYEVVVEQLVTHRIMVLTGGTGQIGGTPGDDGATVLGVIRTDVATGGTIDLRLDLAAGTATELDASGNDQSFPPAPDPQASGAGSTFVSMLRQGVHHISGGTDHLLFLLTLLIPAPLLAVAGHWRDPATARHAARRILGVTVAFTAGHSLSLLLSALTRWSAPAQPIEVLIAVSILVSAAHALRPLFPGREVVVAGVFGLVHGLAFAFELIELGVGTGSLVTSVLGFNLGIELMQLLVVAVLLPPLVVLASTRAYRPLRITTAAMAAAAALVWVVDRLVGWQSAAAIADSLRWAGPVVAIALWSAALAVVARRPTCPAHAGTRAQEDTGRSPQLQSIPTRD